MKREVLLGALPVPPSLCRACMSRTQRPSMIAAWRSGASFHHGAWAHERAFERCVRLHVDATCTECTRRVRVDTCSAARDHDGEVCTVGMAV